MRIILIVYISIFSIHSWGQATLEQLEDDISSSKVLQNLNDTAKPLSLQGAIEEGLRKNYEQLGRKYEFQLNEIVYKDAFDDFFFPRLNLTMATTNDHFTENFFRDNDQNAESPRTPTGAIGLELEDYTLFNWGRDYLVYLNAKETYNRTKVRFSDDRRELRLKIIGDYFNLARRFRIVQILKKQLSHTSFIYRLAKEKLTLRKIRTQEFLQAKSLFLEAHKLYHNALFEYYQTQETMAETLGDGLKTIYKPINALKFKAITLSSKEAYRFVAKNNPELLDARTELRNANRSYQKVMKDNLPLPTFSVKLGTYQRTFGVGGYDDNYETFAGSKNIELAATLNMSWRIYGSGGLFNSRVTETSFYNKKLSELKLREQDRLLKVGHKLTHSRILYLEKKYEATEAELKNARKLFDKSIDDYLASKLSFSAMQQVLEHLRTANIDLENTKYEHLIEKLTLSQLMGLDDFPGDKFDQLVRN